MSNTVKIKRRYKDVVVFQGDDAAAVENARRVYNEEATNTTRAALREGDASPLVEAAQALDAARDAGLANAVTVTVQQLGRKTYRRLKAQCPPRDDDKNDEQAGYNTEAFAELVLEFIDPVTGERSIVNPPFDSQADLVDWLDDQSDGTFEDLFWAAIEVNEGHNPDPKASATSHVEKVSAATSKSPARIG